MGAPVVQPEDRRLAGLASAVNCELDPVVHGDVLGLTCSENVAHLYRLLHEDRPAGVLDKHSALRLHLKRLVVRAILLRLLRHQPHVGARPHGCRVQLPVLLAVLDSRLIDAGVAAVRDHADGILKLVVLVPHLAAVAHHVRHGRVDDHVVGRVQVRDALRRVDHRKPALRVVAGVDVLLDLCGLRLVVHLPHRLQEGADAVVGVHAQLLEGGGMLSKDVREVGGDDVAEHDGVGHLHHGGLKVERQQHALPLGLLHRLLHERVQGLHVQRRAVHHLSFLHSKLLKNFGATVLSHKLKGELVCLGHGHRLF
mmetsp:Transcript_25363/g.55146  ORF Transcript_25363/g.55146 Transcript_25363/m.55146 type:complete len:311 (-) Transcript_25363:657-1589(-)